MWSNTQVKIAQLAAICMLLILSVQILKWISSNEFGIEASGSRERKYGGIEMSDTKKAVLIIAREIFRDEELFHTQAALEAAGVQTVVASSKVGICRGKLGALAETTVLVDNLKADDFDAIVFIGGIGAKEYYDSPAALNLAKDADAKGKVVAAICIAPRILANAGLLESVKATCYESETEALKKLGADFQPNDVVRDGKIVTANGPHAATNFGKTIAQALEAD